MVGLRFGFRHCGGADMAIHGRPQYDGDYFLCRLGVIADTRITDLPYPDIGASIFATYGVFWGLITSRGPFHISEATMVDSEQRVTATQSAD